jgi:hypothetical protein
MELTGLSRRKTNRFRPESDAGRDGKNRSQILALAVTVGLFTFFATDSASGGLTGPQGFLIGMSSVIGLFFLTTLFSESRRPTEDRRNGSATVGGWEDVTVHRSENGDEITIRIRSRPEGRDATTKA